jgi:hypothetical protein
MCGAATPTEQIVGQIGRKEMARSGQASSLNVAKQRFSRYGTSRAIVTPE